MMSQNVWKCEDVLNSGDIIFGREDSLSCHDVGVMSQDVWRYMKRF